MQNDIHVQINECTSSQNSPAKHGGTVFYCMMIGRNSHQKRVRWRSSDTAVEGRLESPYFFSVHFPSQAAMHRIVVATCITSGVLFSLGLPAGHFTHVLVDEAGQATEPECLIPMGANSQSDGVTVLAGDPFQLGPVLSSRWVQRPLLWALWGGNSCNLSSSQLGASLRPATVLLGTPAVEQHLLSWWVRLPSPPGHKAGAQLSGARSHPGALFAALLRQRIATACGRRGDFSRSQSFRVIFGSTDEITSVGWWVKRFHFGKHFLFQLSDRLLTWPGFPSSNFPLTFIGIRGSELRDPNSPSFFNPAEVVEVVRAAGRLLAFGLASCDVGIITPYRKQVEKIRELLASTSGADLIKVGSVEEFQGGWWIFLVQFCMCKTLSDYIRFRLKIVWHFDSAAGQERPAIVVSTVRSDEGEGGVRLDHTLGFLANPKRFNVTISRAQAGLVIIGNPFVLCNDPQWLHLLRYVLANGSYSGCDLEPIGHILKVEINASSSEME